MIPLDSRMSCASTVLASLRAKSSNPSSSLSTGLPTLELPTSSSFATAQASQEIESAATAYALCVSATAECIPAMVPFAPSPRLVHSYQSSRRGESMAILGDLWCASLRGDFSPTHFPCTTSPESMALRDALKGGVGAAHAAASSSSLLPLGLVGHHQHGQQGRGDGSSSSSKRGHSGAASSSTPPSGLSAVGSFREEYDQAGKRAAAAEVLRLGMEGGNGGPFSNSATSTAAGGGCGGNGSGRGNSSSGSQQFRWPTGPEHAIQALGLSVLPPAPTLPLPRCGYTPESLELLGSLRAYAREGAAQRLHRSVTSRGVPGLRQEDRGGMPMVTC